MKPVISQRHILNWCNTCQKDFGSVGAFDAHRTGVFAYDYSAGLKLDPPREDGRRCLTTEEMIAKGMRQDPRGRWRSAPPSANFWKDAA